MTSAVRQFVFSTILALATLTATSLFWNQPSVATIILVGLSILMFTIEPKRANLLLYFYGFIFGPVAEVVAIRFGAWHYTYPFVIGIPLWLPLVWGNCGLYIIRVKTLIDLV